MKREMKVKLLWWTILSCVISGLTLSLGVNSSFKPNVTLSSAYAVGVFLGIINALFWISTLYQWKVAE